MEKFRIALFGGSFDPPTIGHIHVAEQLLEQGIVDRFVFVPAYVSYHHKNYIATPEQRVEMLNIMIQDSEYKDSLGVCTFEIDNQMKTCTYDFVNKYLKHNEELIAEFNVEIDEQYYFVVGMDNGAMIPRFKQGDKLIKRLPFIVVNRGAYTPTNDQWFDEEPHIVADIGNNYEDCSSTKIREVMKNFHQETEVPKDFFRELCIPSVFAYMVNNELYGDKDVK